MTVKLKYIIIVLLLASATEAFAQGGSNYSIFGIGDINHSPSAFYDGMAGTSIAMPSLTSVNYKNPATWGLISNTRLQAGYRFNQHHNESGDYSIWQNNGKIDGFFIIFKVDSALGASASIGMAPYSLMNYLIAAPITVNLEGQKVTGTAYFQGSGGITQAYGGISIKPIENLFLGASIFALIGKSNFYDQTDFPNPNYNEATNLREDVYKGMGIRGGLFYKLFDNINLGAFMEFTSDLNIESEITIASELLPDSVINCTSSLNFPVRYGFGMSYEINRFVIGADASFQDFTGTDYRTTPNVEYRQSQNFSIGAYRKGNTSYSAPYGDKITYKLGFGYQKLYYTFKGNDINEVFGSIGLTFPLPGTGLIESALTLGKRSDAGSLLIYESFAKLSVDISIGDTWFKPFKREY